VIRKCKCRGKVGKDGEKFPRFICLSVEGWGGVYPKNRFRAILLLLNVKIGCSRGKDVIGGPVKPGKLIFTKFLAI